MPCYSFAIEMEFGKGLFQNYATEFARLLSYLTHGEKPQPGG